MVAPLEIKAIQTDNGAEFHKYFDDYLTKKITHFWNYPKSPKMNAFVERFNDMIQKQYIGWYFNELIEPDSFNKGLMQYLIWYNTDKPHRSIDKLSPLLYYVNNCISLQKSNMCVDGTEN